MCLCLGTYKFNGKGSPLENPIHVQRGRGRWAGAAAVAGAGERRCKSNPFAASILGGAGVASRTQAYT